MSAAGQIPGGGAGLIAVSLDDLLYPFDGGRGYLVEVAVEDVGYGGGADTGLFGDGFQIHGASPWLV